MSMKMIRGLPRKSKDNVFPYLKFCLFEWETELERALSHAIQLRVYHYDDVMLMSFYLRKNLHDLINI